MATALDPRICAALGPAYSGQADKLSAQFIGTDGTVLATGIAFTERPASSGNYVVATPTDTSWVGEVFYTWTGNPSIPFLPPDVITVQATSMATLDLTQAIPVSPRPAVGSVGEALAAARAAATGNETKPSANAVGLLASDDATVLSTLTYAPSIISPTSRTRS